jgi:hypothetical protein
MSPEERAEYLKSDDSMTSAHQESAQEGQTEVSGFILKNLFLTHSFFIHSFFNKMLFLRHQTLKTMLTYILLRLLRRTVICTNWMAPKLFQ